MQVAHVVARAAQMNSVTHSLQSAFAITSITSLFGAIFMECAHCPHFLAVLIMSTTALVAVSVAQDAKSNTVTTQEAATQSLGTVPIPREVFKVDGHNAFLMMPAQHASDSAIPWVWYAPAGCPGLPGPEEDWMLKKFLDAGIAIAGIDVGDSYGSPQGRTLYSSLYNKLVSERGFSKRACLLARSRGGLMLYNWAVEHPSCVACVAGIYPVCDIRSFPGVKNACAAYGMTEDQLNAKLAEHNPIDRVESLAEAQVPIYHIHGDSDGVVPLDANSGELARRYRQLGGVMTLNVIKGQGHNMWPGWFQCQELVDFVIAQAHKRSPTNCTQTRP